jgi:serine protease
LASARSGSEWIVVGNWRQQVPVGTGDAELSGRLSRTSRLSGGSLVIAAHLTDAIHHAAIAGATVRLYARRAGSTSFTRVASRVGSSSGAASVSVSPHVNTYYQWRFAGNADYAAATSLTRKVLVARLVSIHQTATTIAPGSKLTLWGTVKPGAAGRTVYLQSHNSTGWHTLTNTALIKSQRMPDGVTRAGYVLTFTPKTALYRIYRPATSINAAGYSAGATVSSS